MRAIITLAFLACLAIPYADGVQTKFPPVVISSDGKAFKIDVRNYHLARTNPQPSVYCSINDAGCLER